MRPILFLTFCFLFCALAEAASLDRYIIETEHLSSVIVEIKNESGIIVRPMRSISGLVVYLPTQSAEKLKNKIFDLKITKDIEMHAVTKDITFNRKPIKPPPPQTVPWGISRIRAREANLFNKGEGIKVCVVDTGIDRTHSDLTSNIVGGRNFVVMRGVLNPSNWNDDNGHGTHVSGIIAAVDNSIGVVGVAPKAQLYAVKVLDKRGSGYLSDVADGVDECVRAGAKVINMSLGATANPNENNAFKTAVENAQSAGVVVVVAAGNEGQDIANTVPAGYHSVIAVGATNSSNKIASWSNFGLDNNDFVAPGVSIYSTWKGNSYYTISGTSMASPHVAGVVALHLSSKSSGLNSIDLSYSMSMQGLGLIDALGSVK